MRKVAFLPYKPFHHLKENIIKRDGKKSCLLCGGFSKKGYTNIHHIDYNKLNNNLDNLCVLCPSCNTRAKKNRDYWKSFLIEKIQKEVQNVCE